MIISRAEIESAVAAYRTGTKKVSRAVAPEAAEVVVADTFAPSEEAASLTALREQVVAQPYYRQRLVNELKRRIEEGRYYVPADQIVEKMLGRLIVENLGFGT
ncbi:MAG: flagellar biosynthesis anti-sigma factor FlgM [Candidatus Eremiobacteraeota bacterium]|nr:flagellar biosynthesis anti-sigma factor FlgM [Candidatus Eremiobacteraeota bacterium]MBV8355780.1 flagellar biosynthesis anti-sigma factor FlgM [Candidatus Eremiobacteraeota bacterium]